MSTPTEGGKVTPFEPGVMAAVARGLASTLHAAAEWFGPGEPMQPTAPEDVEGRQLDYPAQFNIQTRPRVYEATQFADLRYLSESCEMIRMVIETRKDQMCKLKWKIAYKDQQEREEKKRKAENEKLKAKKAEKDALPKEGPKLPFGKASQPFPPPEDEKTAEDPLAPTEDPEEEAREAEVKKVQNFLAFPDKRHDWATWLRMILEDLFVLDAPTIYVRKTKGGDIWGFEPVDGATISPLIDASGRMPMDGPAYVQTLKGVPAVHYTFEELVYAPRNARPHKVYGYSPVEQIQWLANLVIRRELHKLNYYTAGSTPDLIMRVPETWTPDQIKAYKKWWDTQLRGNSKERRGTMFVVSGSDPIDTKERALKDEFDEWLARLVCFAFSISPQSFVKEMNRATAETQQESSLTEGLEPLKLWAKSLMDQLLMRGGYSEMEFTWEEEESVEPKEAAEIAQIYVGAGIKTKNEVREELGMDPIEGLDDPPPPPPMFGAAPTVPGTPGVPPEAQPPEEGAPQAASGKKPNPFERVAKAKPRRKTLPKINRERPFMEASIVELQGGIAIRLEEFKKRIVRSLTKVAKKRTPNQELEDIITAKDWEAFENWLAKQLAPIYKDGALVAAAQMKVTTNLSNEEAVKWAAERAGELITQISETTREEIRVKVAQASAEGWSTDELADELTDSWGFDPSRAEMIARTESAFADIAGNRALYEASGMVSKVEWIMADADVCDICEELDGKIMGVDIDKSELPPAHPNCRCDILPILDPEEGA